MTEIYDYLRLLYARIGETYCYKCGKRIERQTVQQIADRVLAFPKGSKIQILAPLVRGRKGEYRELFNRVRKDGYIRVRVDGEIRSLDEEIKLEKNKKHSIDVVVDRLIVEKGVRQRLTESLETALKLASGIVRISVLGGEERVFSEHFACLDCGISYEELAPRMFSFNSPYGACHTCSGLGTIMDVDPKLVIQSPKFTVRGGAIATIGENREGWYFRMLDQVAAYYGYDLNTPWRSYDPDFQRILLYGSGEDEIRFRYIHSQGRGVWEHTSRFEGIIPNLKRRYRQTRSSYIREWIEGFMSVSPCTECGGERLRPESRAVKIGDKSISQFTRLSIKAALDFLDGLRLSQKERIIARQILKEIKARLGFLVNVGLDYLTLERSAGTLSGGEAQRIHLATQIGSQLVGVLYILDEPSIGLHQRDNRRLIRTLTQLRDLGNTVLVVEHDRGMIESADFVVDLGPGAGRYGGEVVTTGTVAEIRKHKGSITGRFLTGKEKIPVPPKRRSGNHQYLRIIGARGNNLKAIDVEIPLGTFICVTGVSGSGKSTLVDETLYRILSRKFYRSKELPLDYDDFLGMEYIDKVINIDQSPIGRTPRSNAATYTGVFTYIRDLYAQLPESKIRGYKPGRFSFNVKGGRCDTCQGDGVIKIEMHFLPDVYVTCEECKGKRYNRETLEIGYKGRSIAEVLGMSVAEALGFFKNIPRIRRKLETLSDVGLGYIHLGQSATTLSGGEAQRVKLSTELSKVATGRTVYILDEPTTGLHFADVRMLLSVLNRLVDKGNTVIVIEHNMDVIKTADWIIDLGPEGGDEGGEVVAVGHPEEIIRNERSYTADFLKKELAVSK